MPEGDDKPLKYPLLFHLAKVVVINKCDLLPYVDFSMKRAKKNVLRENSKARIFEVSAKTGDGFGEFYSFLEKELNAKKKKG
jgi:hydrogenase nickel incorporation protein HypB